jgi:hypothetical protein
MATIALGIVGGYLGGPYGSQIGMAVGAYIDAQYLFPLMNSTDHPPSVNDFGLSGLSPGSPIIIAIGGKCRFPGQYIWTSEVRELESSQGGKHGGGQQAYMWDYNVDIAVSLGDGPYFVGTLNSDDGLQKVLADNQVIYDTSPPPVAASNDFELESYAQVWIDPTTGQTRVTIKVLVIHEGTSGIDLSVFRVGAQVGTVQMGSGVTGSPSYQYNNSPSFPLVVLSAGKTHPVTGKSFLKLRGDTYTSVAFESTPAYGGVAVLGGPLTEASVFYWDPQVFSTSSFASLTFYPGEGLEAYNPARQPIDGTIFAEINEGQSIGHAFAGLAYFKILNLNLNPYGNRFPMFEVIAKQQVHSYQSALAYVFNRGGMLDSQYDVSKVDPYLMGGYIIRGPMAIREALQPLAVAMDILGQEDEDRIRLFNRTNAEVVVIDDEDIGTAPPGEQSAFPVKFTNVNSSKKASQFVVSFNDIDNDCQPNSVRAIRVDVDPLQQLVNQITLPISMTVLEAQLIADRLLWQSNQQAKRFQMQLPFKYIIVGENTKIQFNAFGKTWVGLVQTAELSATSGCIQVEGFIDHQIEFTAQSSNYSERSGNVDRPSPLSNPLITGIVDVAGLFEEDLDIPGVYLPTTQSHPGSLGGSGATGGVLFYSEHDAEDYRQVKVLPQNARIGRTTDVLAPGPIGIWDTTSTVNIVLEGDATLENRTEDEVLNGANHGVIGGEVIAWQHATLESDGSWTLSQLLRGLRDTDDAIALHAVNDGFYQVDRNTRNFVPLHRANLVNKTIDFKFVPTRGLVDDAQVVTVTVRSQNAKPFKPTSLTVSPATNGWLIGWEPVTRVFYDMFGEQLWTDLETSEEYRLELFADGSNVLTDIPALTISARSTEHNLTNAEVESAFTSIPTSFIVSVRQLGRAGVSKPAYTDVAGSSGGTSTVDPFESTLVTVPLANEFSTTSETPVNVTGLEFTPQPGSTYLVEVYLIIRSEEPIVTTLPGIVIPTEMTPSGHWMQVFDNN